VIGCYCVHVNIVACCHWGGN